MKKLTREEIVPMIIGRKAPVVALDTQKEAPWPKITVRDGEHCLVGIVYCNPGGRLKADMFPDWCHDASDYWDMHELCKDAATPILIPGEPILFCAFDSEAQTWETPVLLETEATGDPGNPIRIEEYYVQGKGDCRAEERKAPGLSISAYREASREDLLKVTLLLRKAYDILEDNLDYYDEHMQTIPRIWTAIAGGKVAEALEIAQKSGDRKLKDAVGLIEMVDAEAGYLDTADEEEMQERLQWDRKNRPYLYRELMETGFAGAIREEK